MTERLRQLMHDEVVQLTPPAPDAGAVLAEGRRLRRRSRVTTGVAALAVAAVVVDHRRLRRAQHRRPRREGPRPGRVGRRRHRAADVRRRSWRADPRSRSATPWPRCPGTVHSTCVTPREGVLVRSNPNGGASDGSGPESLTLVRSDGSTADLGTIPEGVGPATDPEQRSTCWPRPTATASWPSSVTPRPARRWTRSPLPDLPTSYWDVPPLALDGDTLYVGYRNETVAVDLATGEEHAVTAWPAGSPTWSAGGPSCGRATRLCRSATWRPARSCSIVHKVEEYAWGTLSPDWCASSRSSWTTSSRNRSEVYDIAAGTAQEFEDPYGWGWTADGGMFKVEQDTLTTCDAATGACEEVGAVPGAAEERRPAPRRRGLRD